MAVVIQNLDQPDYTYLGQDITVVPDLSEDEILVVDGDCLIQDIINGWSQPTGIADGIRVASTQPSASPERTAARFPSRRMKRMASATPSAAAPCDIVSAV